ncbi:L-rhamnose mutarotase [Faecalicatena sp. AGMB00832]|uniref:L-rhamnose mutarotase n=1 Tax=Faecalicatena faecalis TaxID=2726362 RepID=A0ABS6D585_9FIRM|nr:L-rhamnose mutarotase [Faecalicatena faecalis]MBU3876644.1 L-rhamnose mutarotase [Faecalicatena faecalis]
MKRTGIYFQLKDGAREGYVEAHKNIWPQMREVLNEAGIQNYSIWNLGQKLFAYYETEDEEQTQKVLACSEVYGRWRDMMEEFVYIEEGTGTKEWPMELVFYNQGKEREDL